MSEGETGLAIAALVVATLLTRCSLWVVGRHVTLPKRLQNALRYAPACVLTAIIVPDLLLANGQLHLNWSNDKLMAALAALLFYLVKRDMLQTMVLGMVCFTALRLGIF